MATAASLAGIGVYGSGWRHKITLNIPDDIPRKIRELETTTEVNEFVDGIVSSVHKKLKSAVNSFPSLPRDAKEPLTAMLKDLEEGLLGDPFDPTVNSDPVLDAEVVENKVEDLMYFLEDLYDWGDYYRVLITTPRL